MVDKLLYSDDNSAKTSFRINNENVLVMDGEFTEAGLMENIAQTAAARAGQLAIMENKPIDVGYIGTVKNFEIFDLPKVSDELITEVHINNHVFDVAIITGVVKRDDIVVAQCEMNIFINK